MTESQGRTSAGLVTAPAGRARRSIRSGAAALRLAVAATLGLALGGCDGLLKSDQLPPNVKDPAYTETPEGALAAYRGVLVTFRRVFGGVENQTDQTVITAGGVLGDELQYHATIEEIPNAVFNFDVDRRTLSETGQHGHPYADLHRVRGQGGQAIGLLRDYVPEQPALAGRLFALVGYAEVFLAELFCSGIPLSTLDYKADYTLQPGSTTSQVFTHAAALFDTALALSGDSIDVMNLALVGKARALLALNQFQEAAALVAAVPDEYSYLVRYSAETIPGGDVQQNFAVLNTTSLGAWKYSVADGEGLRGLDYISSGDPRTTVRAASDFIKHPEKYSPDGTSPLVLASGVEARLIEAEAALQGGDVDTWLAKLNALRTNGTQDGNGTYNPGTGGVAGLAPLADPGTADGRVDLLFRERAFWLFLTGHRQGDMRRLVRLPYGRSQLEVYPTGTYPNPAAGGPYGDDVNFPVPASERTSNPLYTGCASRGA